MKNLHILNGQGTAFNFKLEGDYLIWDEALAWGEVHPEVGSDAFFQVRKNFFQRQLAILPTRHPQTFSDEEFQKVIVEEIQKLNLLNDYEEVILWFEFDWFCQINLMAVLSWFFQNQKSNLNISLVCIDKHPEIEDFRGMGELDSEHFPDLFAQRKKLSFNDIVFGDKVWLAYASGDIDKLLALEKDIPSKSFPYYSKAFFHFLTLFPHKGNGLNSIEQQLLEILENSDLKTIHQWVGKMLIESNPYFGFGDLQYYDAIRRMQALWKQEEIVELTELGNQVLKNEVNFLEVNSESYLLGGAKSIDFIWNEEILKLIKV